MEWQWQGDQGQWELYSEDAQQALSEAYSSIPGRQLLQRRPGPGQPSVVQLVFTLPASPQHAQPKQQMYEMDFFSRPMVQRNVGSGKQRSIRLVAAVPPVDRLSLPTRIQEPQPEGAPAADEQDSSAADDIGASAASSAHRARRIEIYTEHRPRKVQDVDQLLEPEPELELEPELESGGAGAAAEVREELLEIYMRSQPEKVANVDRLMRQWLDYGHSIHELLGTVRAKFAPVEDDDGSEAAAGAEPAHELAVAVQPGGEQQAPVLESGNQQSGREDAVRAGFLPPLPPPKHTSRCFLVGLYARGPDVRFSVMSCLTACRSSYSRYLMSTRYLCSPIPFQHEVALPEVWPHSCSPKYTYCAL
jgi:hypothetical protein